MLNEKTKAIRSFLILSAALRLVSGAEIPRARPLPQPDDRYKADILVVVAHPDDETDFEGYLSRAIYDQHRRVAVVFCTRGNSGENGIGLELAWALAAEREIEARRALESQGVMNVWFLNGEDTPGQDVLRSLENWNHGSVLWNAVRLVRLTRPEVILTWLPDYVAGENHGDHQAAGVIATEAFDVAGDPTEFPEQVAPARKHPNLANLVEGLQPWQSKKLYYLSDASHREFLEGKGPTYSTSDVSASRQISYSRMTAEEGSFHQTQHGGQWLPLGATNPRAQSAAAPAGANAARVERPMTFIFGKGAVRSSTAAEIFDGITPDAVPFLPATGYRPQPHSGVWMELGGSWAFYRDFWKAHDIGHLAELLPEPEIGARRGGALFLPLRLHNDTAQPVDITLNTAELPEGWKEQSGTAVYPVRPGETYPVEVTIAVAAREDTDWHEIRFTAEAAGKSTGEVRVRVMARAGGLPQ